MPQVLKAGGLYQVCFPPSSGGPWTYSQSKFPIFWANLDYSLIGQMCRLIENAHIILSIVPDICKCTINIFLLLNKFYSVSGTVSGHDDIKIRKRILSLLPLGLEETKGRIKIIF